jgi:hypothetical protein
MNESFHECYGFRVRCLAHPDARDVVDRVFGPPPGHRGGLPHGQSPTVQLEIDVVDSEAPAPVPPPYFPPDWERAEPMRIDLSSSRAVISPAAWTVRISLARGDLDNPIVWGRWLLEKAFLLLTLRSPQHYGLHSGAIALGGHGVIVTADSGVGKSTFTSWGFRRGADFVGEDALMRHLCDDSGQFWGYPRAAYLDPELIAGWPELKGATAAAVPGREKLRLEWPSGFEDRLRPRIRPTALVFLTRGHGSVRAVEVDEAVERCRSDFAAGKLDAGVLSRVEADVRRQFGRMRLLEFGLTVDLDANLQALMAALRHA